MATRKSPRVFVSCASEDWDRFISGLSRRLRAVGTDAWVACWEILPGDSLVQKIFQEGLAQADVVIVVLSPHKMGRRTLSFCAFWSSGPGGRHSVPIGSTSPTLSLR